MCVSKEGSGISCGAAGARGRVHITEIKDEAAPPSAVSPLERLKPGNSIKAVVLGMVPTKYVSPADLLYGIMIK